MNSFLVQRLARRLLASLIVRMFFAIAGVSVAQAQNVEVFATARWTSETEIVLSVDATIADGIHIYGLEQSRPILATKIQIEPSDDIESLGAFETITLPKRRTHEQLGIEVIEHFGRVQWQTRIFVREGRAPAAIQGSVFAQACEDEKCFPPETLAFRAEIIGSRSDSNASSVSSELPSVLDSLQVSPTTSKQATIWSILPIAFVAGLLLNFMPCVLPVVGIKLLSLVKQADLDRRRIMLTNVVYSAGLISVMVVLASLAVFAGFGWGEQFSHLGFNVTLTGLVFAFSLSLLGVWELPSIGISQTSKSSDGYGAAFGNGVLSTVLATPCSGPFLGVALAWAVAQPAYWTYAVFVTIGLGMASPFLLIGIFPKLVRFLPRPGAWMIVFKQLTGFVMLASVVYLLSTLPAASVVPTLLLLLGIGIALWMTSFVPVYESIPRKLGVWTAASVVVIAVAVVSFGWLKEVSERRFEREADRLFASRSNGIAAKTREASSFDKKSSIAWEDFSRERLESLLQEGQPVFIDFTADWCLTCKSNELLAIETEGVADALKAGNVVAMRADKTTPNPNADQLLRKLGNSSASIPFYALFKKGQPKNPIVMDGLYSSPDAFVKNIQSAL